MRLPTAPDGSRGCAALGRYHGEPHAGTASRTTGWLLIEHPGPWRHPALNSDGLDRRVVAELEARIGARPIRPQLIKRSRGSGAGEVRTAYFVHSAREGAWAREVEFRSLEELLAYDTTAVERPGAPDFGIPVEHPLYLVCTHAKKDPCCALSGRPVAAALARSHPHVWETTHLGGDRFAANLVALPQGVYFGRLTPDTAEAVVRDFESGAINAEHLRGRCTDTPHVQAAEAAVRRHLGLHATDAIEPQSEQRTPQGYQVVFRRRERPVTAVLTETEGPTFVTTCSAAEPSTSVRYQVTDIG